jgi:hypothetical protein
MRYINREEFIKRCLINYMGIPHTNIEEWSHDVKHFSKLYDQIIEECKNKS